MQVHLYVTLEKKKFKVSRALTLYKQCAFKSLGNNKNKNIVNILIVAMIIIIIIIIIINIMIIIIIMK